MRKHSVGTLLIQSAATSIDTLSVGTRLKEYYELMAFAASLIIAAVTFFL